MNWVYAFLGVLALGLLMGLTELIVKRGWKYAAMSVIEFGGPLLTVIGILGTVVALMVYIIGAPGG